VGLSLSQGRQPNSDFCVHDALQNLDHPSLFDALVQRLGQDPAFAPVRWPDIQDKSNGVAAIATDFAPESQTELRNGSLRKRIDGSEAALGPPGLQPNNLSRSVCVSQYPSKGTGRLFHVLEAESAMRSATAQTSGAEASTLLPFRCPKTLRLMNTSIKTDCVSLAKAWSDTMKISAPIAARRTNSRCATRTPIQ
jgi:hypothetical protein